MASPPQPSVTLLNQPEGDACPGQGKRAPLTYSQLNHWQLYHSGGRPGFRNVVSAVRLNGELRPAALLSSREYRLQKGHRKMSEPTAGCCEPQQAPLQFVRVASRLVGEVDGRFRCA